MSSPESLAHHRGSWCLYQTSRRHWLVGSWKEGKQRHLNDVLSAIDANGEGREVS